MIINKIIINTAFHLGRHCTKSLNQIILILVFFFFALGCSLVNNLATPA